MFQQLIPNFRQVIKLAEERRLYYDEKYGMNVITFNSNDYAKYQDFLKSPEGKEIQKKEKMLEDYLDSLDFEIVKIIQTIMYLGRDEDYNKEDAPEIRYQIMRDYFDSSGWNTKEIEINQITEKMPLDIYLINGLRLLGIDLAV
mgnify:CR=1 FL=1